MIKLTKNDHEVIALNERFIEHICEAPDTIVTMNSGKSYVVKESIDEIIRMIEQFTKKCNK